MSLPDLFWGQLSGSVYLIQGVRRYGFGAFICFSVCASLRDSLGYKVAAVLLRHGANVHIKDDDGVSVVDGAQSGSNAEILDLVMAVADGTLHPTPAPD